MSYQLLISLHVTTVAISISLFVWRGAWVLRYGQHGRPHWMKWVPHTNDTLLLVSGVWLAIMLQQNPFVQTWLSVKLITLLLYILLGMVVMKWANQRHWQLAAWLAALLVYGYMISVAVTKYPLWFLD